MQWNGATHHCNISSAPPPQPPQPRQPPPKTTTTTTENNLRVAEAAASAALVAPERQTVAMEFAAALHHSRDVGRTPAYGHTRRRAQERWRLTRRTLSFGDRKQPPQGVRPGSLVDPGPQRSDRSLRRSAGNSLPILALPVLAGSAGEVVDSSSLRFLTASALEGQKGGGGEGERE